MSLSSPRLVQACDISGMSGRPGYLPAERRRRRRAFVGVVIAATGRSKRLICGGINDEKMQAGCAETISDAS